MDIKYNDFSFSKFEDSHPFDQLFKMPIISFFGQLCDKDIETAKDALTQLKIEKIKSELKRLNDDDISLLSGLVSQELNLREDK